MELDQYCSERSASVAIGRTIEEAVLYYPQPGEPTRGRRNMQNERTKWSTAKPTSIGV
jgi:hypothetical protein